MHSRQRERRLRVLAHDFLPASVTHVFDTPLRRARRGPQFAKCKNAHPPREQLWGGWAFCPAVCYCNVAVRLGGYRCPPPVAPATVPPAAWEPATTVEAAAAHRSATDCYMSSAAAESAANCT